MPPETATETSDANETPLNDIPGISDAIATMPEPQEHAIAEAERQAQASQQTDERKDAHGTPFDPAIHSGTLTPTAHWRKKKGAAQSRVGSSKPNLGIATPAQPAQESNAVAIAQAQAAGAAAAESIIALCRALGGDDFNPIKSSTEDERAALHDAWSQYFIATGKTFSPGWLLVAANGGFIARRFTMPKTQTRMQRLKESFAAWVAKRRMRKNRGTEATADMSIEGDAQQ